MLRIGTRAQVMHGNAKMTGGGLRKKDLKYNKQGKIVSKKMSSIAKKEKRLQKAGWTTKKGQFGAINIKGGKGVGVFYYKIDGSIIGYESNIGVKYSGQYITSSEEIHDNIYHFTLNGENYLIKIKKTSKSTDPNQPNTFSIKIRKTKGLLNRKNTGQFFGDFFITQINMTNVNKNRIRPIGEIGKIYESSLDIHRRNLQEVINRRNNGYSDPFNAIRNNELG